MKLSDINIRDPYILPARGKYYLYGTRSATCWGPAEGFDCYVSDDMEHWEGPVEVFHRPEGFFADRHYWAPECVEHQGRFCLVATLGGEGRTDGVYLLKSDAPTGPFRFVGRLTPEEWNCIDGTLWRDGSGCWLLFSHAFEDDPRGSVCAVPLTEDLERPSGAPLTLFAAPEAPWARPIPFAKAEFGLEGDVYLSDGPCLLSLPEGGLAMSWSSWGRNGYAVGLALSDGGVTGPWRQLETPLFPENGGHGMFFRDFRGKLYFTLHYPNDRYREHPVLFPAEPENGLVRLRTEELGGQEAH